MCKLDRKSGNKRIDPCMENLIFYFRGLDVETLACCCGHGKYPMTLVIKEDVGKGDEIFEVFSSKTIPRKKRFYLKDKQGYYYIPEVIIK